MLYKLCVLLLFCGHTRKTHATRFENISFSCYFSFFFTIIISDAGILIYIFVIIVVKGDQRISWNFFLYIFQHHRHRMKDDTFYWLLRFSPLLLLWIYIKKYFLINNKILCNLQLLLLHGKASIEWKFMIYKESHVALMILSKNSFQ